MVMRMTGNLFDYFFCFLAEFKSGYPILQGNFGRNHHRPAENKSQKRKEKESCIRPTAEVPGTVSVG
jgi:hypothetical protein